mmetsp:Transcript_22693/g.26305  ORF Transcript_22693/g.26305 Transcript_22693/m.26305 type:complete len:288 (-) Transcript_22693:246-1109(-)
MSLLLLFPWLITLLSGIVCALLLFVVSANHIFKVKYEVPKPDSAIFITGCSSGIGNDAAKHYAKRGYYVFATVRKEKDAESLASIPNIIPVICDVTNDESVKKAEIVVARELEKRGLELGAVIANAGILKRENDVLRTKTLESIMNVNVLGAMRVVEAFMPLLKQSKGRILIIGSYFGSFQATIQTVAYGASKHAVEGLAEGMRRMYLADGIAVINIKPGNVSTKLNPEHGEDGPEVLFNDMDHALENPFPQPKYWPGRVAGFSCQWLCRIQSMIPERLGDKTLQIG